MRSMLKSKLIDYFQNYQIDWLILNLKEKNPCRQRHQMWTMPHVFCERIHLFFFAQTHWHFYIFDDRMTCFRRLATNFFFFSRNELKWYDVSNVQLLYHFVSRKIYPKTKKQSNNQWIPRQTIRTLSKLKNWDLFSKFSFRQRLKTFFCFWNKWNRSENMSWIYISVWLCESGKWHRHDFSEITEKIYNREKQSKMK